MEVLALAVMGVVNIACFIIGAKVGQTVQQGKDIQVELPTVSPIDSYRNHQTRKEARKEQEKMDIILRNIEAYDGTGNGQKDVPKG